MKVMVTGGTGFVGSHTVDELIKNGHDVRLLVRAKGKIGPAFQPFGLHDLDVIEGDVLDRESIEKAAEGCDATIHCGSVYSLDPRLSLIIKNTNVTGTENVLDVAHSFGHDPIIHVSSFVALIGVKGAVLAPDSDPTITSGVYFRSKAESDLVARRFQQKGVPVVITYPGSVWGPNDPHFGESCQIARNVLKGYWRISVKGSIPISDVRDVARLHAAILEKGRGPRKYFAPTQNVTLNEVISLISDVTNRKLETIAFPAWALLTPMRALDSLQKILTFRLPYNFQAIYCSSLQHTADDSTTRKDFGIEPRPLKETMIDQIRWMAQKAYVNAAMAGNLSSQ